MSLNRDMSRSWATLIKYIFTFMASDNLKKSRTVVHLNEKVDGSIFLWLIDWDSRQEAVGCCSGREMGILYYVLQEDMLC